MSRQARTPEAREARVKTIMTAALDQFSKVGFEAARLDDIAHAAGVAKGTIYLYFDSKERLLEALVASTISAPLEALEQSVSGSTAPASELLRQFGAFMTQSAADADRRRVMHLVFSEGARFPALARFHHREVIARGAALVRAIIAKGRASGEFVHDEPERFPQLAFAPALMAAVWLHVFDPIEKLDAPALIAAHVDMLLRALKGGD